MPKQSGNTAEKNRAKDAQKTTKKNVQPVPPPDHGGTAAKLVRQAAFLKALPECRFNISVACDKADIARRTFYMWRDHDPEFKEKYDDVLEARLDKWEECLHKNILAGSETSVIFGLKTKGRRRGYSEKESQDEAVIAILSKVVAEEITVREAAYQITMMGYPLPEVIKIELQKGKGEEGEDETISPASSDELDAKYEEAIAGVDKQRAEFLPQRQEEVVALKEELKAADSFSPGASAGESPFEDFSPS